MVTSPLTGGNDITLIRTINSSELVHKWRDRYQMDIAHELLDCPEIDLYQCNQTKLKFFTPADATGSSMLYENLEQFGWYYMSDKWEYNAAIKDLQKCGNILEVGCGRGAFLERLQNSSKINAQGVELNSNAANYARKKGLSVYQTDLNKLVEEASGSFDAVCSFQVLEHVAKPQEFLESLIKLLKPTGKLIISVPNSEAFPKFDETNLLDQPPHHMTQWCKESFRSLSGILPIRLKHFKVEPLAPYHIDWYISVQISRVQNSCILRKLAYQLAYPVRDNLNRYPLLRAMISGHTLYVCFEKHA